MQVSGFVSQELRPQIKNSFPGGTFTVRAGLITANPRPHIPNEIGDLVPALLRNRQDEEGSTICYRVGVFGMLCKRDIPGAHNKVPLPLS